MPNPSHTFSLEAVVLRHSDWGEADRILTLFTLQQGKTRALAKGVRKLRSRKAGHLQPFTRARLFLARSRDLPIITQAETAEAYLPLHDDLLRTAFALYVVELADRFTYENEDLPNLFHLLTDTLGRLATLPHDDLWLVSRWYEVRLLDILGFRPELFQCVSCGRELKPEDQFFSAQMGGALCPECGTEVTAVFPVSMPALRLLRHLQRSGWMEASRAPAAAELRPEVEGLLQYYLTYLLERGLNSPAFLRHVQRQGGTPA
ncbi:MAG TPA: DNA repair protein RecO [Anaerolineaceae bacterium]|nr:DNA repair protein RecO [Anaerolineaceae bacterium]HPN51269.1 DNA repair protein RecO [Anaerolineaceae bacterium]